MFDEMAQTLGGIGGQVKDVLKLVFGKQFLHQRGIHDRAFDKFHAGGNVIAKAAAQIIQADHGMFLFEQMPANVGTDEARRAGDQNL